MHSLFLRKANIQDVQGIHRLLMTFSRQGLLLPRSYSELYKHLRDFFVLDSDNGIQGCCALTITWENLAEIRSLIVSDAFQGQGWGRRLVDASLSEALTLGVYRIFTLTYQTEFFYKMGFEVVEKDVLPQKIWADCLNCPKFPDCCDEVAMLVDL
ncbi:N-acetyltransferase [Desulfovermiculus halophilus]|jgi:amino-acid N-acetyltransferase|uniref:N-acetyltransferase n=1 Tax=Desulfovermiculus halophilus TaxID=339722 RepID=UPI00047FF95A|nr:N-acetyltransferase [Desulfovermiculus halophilus]